MHSLQSSAALGLAVCLAIGLAGCPGGSTSNGPDTAAPASVDAHDGPDHSGHAHASDGPHQGDLIELGDEEYHAELLHDEVAGTVTVYVLDSAAAKQVPIDAQEITINARHDGTPEQFPLTASPDENDPEGKSSRFVSNDKELAAHLDEDGADPRLVLMINGKSYRAAIAHVHEHDHSHE